MRLMSFQAPTDYYFQAVKPIDEQICELISQRKQVSEDNPGFPPLGLIAAWCEKYNLNEELMRGVFGSLYHERYFRTRVEPQGLIEFVPILKSVTQNGMTYTVTHMKQYENASVVFVDIEVNTQDTDVRLGHVQAELLISPDYICRFESGQSQPHGIQHSFVVTPPLPDDVSQLEFTLKIKPLPVPPEMRTIPIPEQSVTLK